jgi:hypothetical protein
MGIYIDAYSVQTNNVKSVPNKNERLFIENYFNHNRWDYEPRRFIFRYGEYTPDFYDRKRRVYIEVAGTRQAFHVSKHKYYMLEKFFPSIRLEVRKTNGEIVNTDSNGKYIWTDKQAIKRMAFEIKNKAL